MSLKDYFESTTGHGVLSTSDGTGKINSAVCSRPHFMEDGSLAFLMKDNLTLKNIKLNPHAVYLFREDIPGYKGRRLYLTKIREEENSDLIDSLSWRKFPPDKDRGEYRFLVFFSIDKERPLIDSAWNIFFFKMILSIYR